MVEIQHFTIMPELLYKGCSGRKEMRPHCGHVAEYLTISKMIFMIMIVICLSLCGPLFAYHMFNTLHHLVFARHVEKANERLKVEVDRLKEQVEEKQRDAQYFKVSKCSQKQ